MILSNLSAQLSFAPNSEFRYLKGSSASDLPSNWYTAAYNDIAWSAGMAPFWYGDGNGGTLIEDMQNSYSTFYLRKELDIQNPNLISSILLSIDYDDGFILWINGKEVLRKYAPSVPAYDAFASDLHESGSFEEFDLNTGDMDLYQGKNLVAVQCFNYNLTSSDFHFNLSMSAAFQAADFPDSTEVEFSHRSGYYSSPFDLEISFVPDSASLFYTIDGSHPGSSWTAISINSGESIHIDPEDLSGRMATPAVVLRTAFRKAGYNSSFPESRTFIFLDEVKQQAYPGGSWPSSAVNEQRIDYAMDRGITVGSQYGGRMDEALKDLPALSIITDNASLFDPQIGIYVNAYGHGPAWEKECTVELIYPDSSAFLVNAGLRIRGGWSRHPNFPKHSFRLFFRSEYGSRKLEYPLFGDEGASEFDKIDLRTSQNYAWAQGDSRNTMLREVFSRDTQRDMGQPYTRSRYYHLYLNGMYWGLYQTQERSEARFASTYFGGDPEDYDVIKVNTENWNYQIEATDGNMNLWQEIYNLSLKGFADMESYYRLEGKGASGEPDRSLYKLVDIDNLIDYMLTIFYTGNFDAPTSSFGGNNGANNFFAIKQRNNPTSGFVFFNHDAEHSMFVDAASPGIGLNENRVNIGTRSDDLKMQVTWFGAFHPQWLHFKLSANEEYRNRFSDRVYKHFREEGALDDANALARFDKRKDEIDKAIIAESGRWGDAGRAEGNSLHRDLHWAVEVNSLRTKFLTKRREIVLAQLRAADLFSNIPGPGLLIDGELVFSESYAFEDSIELNIVNNYPTGNIYFTSDGKDPRLSGGGIYGKAKNGGSEYDLPIQGSAKIMSRIYHDGGWGPLKTICFLNTQEDYTGLKISEIHYNPLDSVFSTDTISGDNFEFIEFKNTSDHGINLSGLKLDSAVYYEFPNASLLLPGEFFVIASDGIRFFERYGYYASGVFKRNLSNSGEMIVLSDSTGDPVFFFSYNDKSPWPLSADGQGFSLVASKSNPIGSPSVYSYWLSSHFSGGSPFMDDLNSEIENAHRPESLAQLTLYPNPANDYVVIEGTTGENSGEVHVRLYNLAGVQVYSGNSNYGARIELSGLALASGIYVAHIDDGIQQKQMKLIIVGN